MILLRGFFMKVCQQCGYKNDDANNFCANCAAPFGPQRQPPTGPARGKPRGRRLKTGCAVSLSIASVLFIIIVVIILNSPDENKPAPQAKESRLTREAKAALDQLVESNELITGYDFDKYDKPAILFDFQKIEEILKKDTKAVSGLVDDMDAVGRQLADLEYPSGVYYAMDHEQTMRFAQWENGYVYFDEALIPTGVRVKHKDLVIQYTQVDNSGYFPAITGVILNAGQRTLSSVYIAFNLINAQGNIIGFTNDLISNLESGDTWQFTCEVVVNENYRFKLSEITYF